MEELINDNVPHIREQIFGYLDPIDVLKCPLVCKHWKKTFDESHKLWKNAANDIIQKYQSDRDPEHWQIIQTALKSDEIDIVKKVTRILIWYVKAHKGLLEVVVPRRTYPLGPHPFPRNPAAPATVTIPTPLTVSVIKSPKLLEFLLAFSENKNPPHGTKGTILHIAAKVGNLESLKIITQHLQNKNPGHIVEHVQGVTPFQYALRHRQPSILRYYIDNHFVSDVEVMQHFRNIGVDIDILRLLGDYLDERDILSYEDLVFPLIGALQVRDETCVAYLINKLTEPELATFVMDLVSSIQFGSIHQLKDIIEYAYTRRLRPH